MSFGNRQIPQHDSIYEWSTWSRPRDPDNPFVLKWWTPAHDEVIRETIRKYRWLWYTFVTDALICATPMADLVEWGATDPMCFRARPGTVGWRSELYYFAIFRARKEGFLSLIRPADTKPCRLCRLDFREDSLPASLVDRLGIDQIDFCADCLTDCLPRFTKGNLSSSKEEILSYLQRLTGALNRIPPSDFGQNIHDFFGMTTEERRTVFEVLRVRPELMRIKELFGSWLNALIQAKVLEGDVRRTERGTHCIANDGHVCYSIGEKTIDDLLFALGISHEKEPKYPQGNYRADFRIENVFIEYFGLAGNARYDATTLIKRKLCSANNITLIEIYPKHLASASALKSKILTALRDQGTAS